MIKIRFFLLQALFLFAPLIYAWFYLPGIDYTLGDLVARFFPELHWSGFESVKVFYALLISSFIIALTLARAFYVENKISYAFLLSTLVFSIWMVTSYVLNENTNPYFFFGNPEKTHGLFLYIALFSLFWILRSLSGTEKKRLFSVTFLSFMGVVIYAYFQKYGLDPLRQSYNTRLDLWRIFSTLGNPNYLAGYVLLVLPLLRVYRFPNELSWQEHFWEIGVWLLSGVLIYWTGSYLAWILFVGYVGYVIVDHVLPKKGHRTVFWIVFSCLLLVAGLWIGYRYGNDILASQKMQGFIARWYLWKTGFAALSYDPWHFVFGFGPDGFLAVSEKFRHPLLSVYEDPAYRIDRSHNIFIDFALNFGVPLTLVMLYFIGTSLKSISHDKKVALLIFAVYFSFNIPVLVHFLILLQIFTSAKSKSTLL